MNRDLTINLRINAPTSENARAAAEAVSAVTAAARAGAVANESLAQSNQAVANTATAAAQGARNLGQTIASQSQQMRTATTGMRDFSASVESLDERFADFNRTARDLEQQLDRMEETRRRLVTADRQYLAGINRMIGGVTSLARSVVLLTAANEEDAASMLRMIARFESVAQALRGVISVVQGATTAWTAYATATALAGGTATLGGFAGFGLSAIGGGIATAAGVVGSAAATGAGYIPHVAAGTALASIGLPSAYQAFGVGESEGFVNQGYSSAQRWENPLSLFGSTWSARSNEQASRAGVRQMLGQQGYRRSQMMARQPYLIQQAQQEAALSGLGINYAMLGAGVGLQGGARGVAASEAGLSRIRDRLGEIGGTGNFDDTQDLGVQAEKRREILLLVEQEAQLERQRHDARMQASQEEINTARQRLSIAQQEAEVARQRLSFTRTGLADSDPRSQRELVQAVERAERGDTLSSRDRGALRRFGIRGYEDAILSGEEADIARNPQLQRIYQQQQGLNKPIEAEVKVSSELVVKLEQEFEAQKPVWEAELVKVLDEQFAKIQQAMKDNQEAISRAAAERIRFNMRASEGGGGGGGPIMGSY